MFMTVELKPSIFLKTTLVLNAFTALWIEDGVESTKRGNDRSQTRTLTRFFHSQSGALPERKESTRAPAVKITLFREFSLNFIIFFHCLETCPSGLEGKVSFQNFFEDTEMEDPNHPLRVTEFSNGAG